MIETGVRNSGETGEESLRAELTQFEARGGGFLPTLRHLLAFDGAQMFSDEVLARIRGMQQDIARQICAAAGVVNLDYPLVLKILLDNSHLLSHLHALALEGQIATTLEQSFLIDPVAPSLLQGMISSDDANVQDLARRLIASQARWCQSLQRMQLELFELPAELFDEALAVVRELERGEVRSAEPRLRERYDEATSRLGLAARLVLQMEGRGLEALDLRNGGAALFATALSLGSGQSREQVIFAMQDPQPIKLALGLRAAGLSVAAIQRQLLILNNDGELPTGFEHISVAKASNFITPDLEKG